eukprot:s383_g4.t1
MYTWEQEPQLPCAFGFARLRRRLQDVRKGKVHGMSERPFDKRRRCPENVARLAQHGSGFVGIKAGESVPQLSAPESRWFVGRGWCRACGCKLSRLAARAAGAGAAGARCAGARMRRAIVRQCRGRCRAREVLAQVVETLHEVRSLLVTEEGLQDSLLCSWDVAAK